MSRECPICGLVCERFLPGGRNHRPDAMCPRCRSLERQRLVWLYMQTETDLVSADTPRRLLHIAPEPALESRLGQLPWIDQLTADLDPGEVMVQMDITAIDYPDDSFDIIYCSHVLEHVSDDAAAMRELLRVLRPGGWAILQVPISREFTDEDATVTQAAERTRRFGQDDHVRSYGRDYPERLARAGFRVTVDPYPRRIGLACVERFGLTLHEEIHHVSKPDSGGPGGVDRLLSGWGAGGPIVIGRVEQARDGAVAGWAWKPSAPREHVRVRATVDGQTAGTTIANLIRRSLAEAGIGDGSHGFRLPLSITDRANGPHRLRVEAGEGFPLPAAIGFRAAPDGRNAEAFTLDCSATAGEQLRVLGRVESVAAGVVNGWAWSPSAPTRRMSIRVLIDGADAAESLADRARPSLAKEGIGDGHAGFRLTLPSTFAHPGRHVLRVEADGVPLPAANGFATRADGGAWDGAEFDLDARPRAGERPRVAGHVESVRDRVVSGWVWSPAAPGWRVGVRAVLDGRDVGGDVAGRPRRSLAQAWIGDGRCGFEIRLPEVGGGPHGLRIEAEGGAALSPAASFTTDLTDGDPWYAIDVSATRL